MFCRRLLIVSLALIFAATPVAQAQRADSVSLAGLRWRNIGPASMGGRVVDFEAVERDFKHVFLATASGGVFQSVNAGITWEPIFDRYRSASIGDIAVFQPNPDIIWWGRARRTTGTASRGATESTSPPTAENRSPTWGSRPRIRSRG